MAAAIAQQTVQVYLGSRSYDVFVVTGRLPALGEAIEPWFDGREDMQSGQRLALIVTDEHVAEPHAAQAAAALKSSGWACETFVMPAGEQAKTLDTVAAIYDQLVAAKATRQAVVFAIGGGVIGDTAGFAAATYTRGIAFVQIPTTLLAMVDSSVGGKVGVNHPQAKNLIGAFHQPLGVVIDTNVLGTLPDREYRSGLAEIVKYGVILDEEFFAYMEEHVDEISARDARTLRHLITRSCRLKADIVEQDEYERTGLRAVLNYGHTFGHAYEALTDYGKLLHGEAVSIGMLHASRLAEVLGRITAAQTQRQFDLLTKLGLPTSLPEEVKLGVDDILGRMLLDKKTVGGQLRFVLPTRIGEVELVAGVSQDDVRTVLNEVLA